jgi:hypothetical protein
LRGVRFVDVRARPAEGLDPELAIGIRPGPQLRRPQRVGFFYHAPQFGARVAQAVAGLLGQTGSPQLPVERGREQSLLPGPDDRAVVGIAAELAAQPRARQRGIRHQQPRVRQQPRGILAHDRVDAECDLLRRWLRQQQPESFVRMKDGDGRAKSVE